MYNSIEIFAIILIIVVQCVIAYRTYNQISQLNSFLPEGRNSLTLKEYEIPSEEILDLEPSQVIDRIAYLSSYDYSSSESSSIRTVDFAEQTEQDDDESVIV